MSDADGILDRDALSIRRVGFERRAEGSLRPAISPVQNSCSIKGSILHLGEGMVLEPELDSAQGDDFGAWSPATRSSHHTTPARS